tara:strand:+ start:212 stop:1858 length:1647 start_codon:yes stop_codon:yes gene_type:complete
MSRIRANKITNQAADGAPVVEKGLIVTGILTATGNISVGGTLTYEDVTNVDSVGVITARSTIDAQGDVSIADKIIHSGDTNTVIRFPSADNISFETAGVERLRIDSTGRVAIGLSAYTNTSASEYDAAANTLIVGTGSGDEGITILSGQSVGHHGSIFFADGTGATNSKRGQLRYEQNNEVMSFYTAGTEKVRINAAGNVGIGTDNPTASLQINQSSPKIILEDNNNAADVSIANNGGSAVYSSLLDVVFQTATLERFRIQSGGNVGIGTNNPTEQLEIYNGTSGGDATFRMRSLDGSTKITLDARGTNDSSFIYFTDSGSATYNSFIQRSHSSNAAFAGLRYCYDSSASEAFRISESGGFDMGSAGYGTSTSTGYAGQHSSNTSKSKQALVSNGDAPPNWAYTNRPAFFARQATGTSQTIDHGTWTKVNVDITVLDTDGAYDATTNKRFTVPTGGAGFYMCFFSCGVDDIQAGDYVYSRLYLNGTGITHGIAMDWAASANAIIQANGSHMVYMDDGDYLELYVYHQEGTTEATEQSRCYFGAFRLNI